MFHVDESADEHFHFHAGVLVEARDAAKASDRLDDIVEAACDARLCRSNAELHAADIIAGKNGWKGPVDGRIDVMRKALGVLGPHHIEVIAHGADLAKVRKRYGKKFDPYRWEFMNLLERLNERLSARDEYAVVIADQHAQHRERVQKDVIDSRVYGTGGYRNQLLTRIVDTAHFVDSHLSRMTQLADLVVSILRRRASFPTEHDPRAEAVNAELYDLVFDAIPDPKAKYRTVRT